MNEVCGESLLGSFSLFKLKSTVRGYTRLVVAFPDPCKVLARAFGNMTYTDMLSKLANAS